MLAFLHYFYNPQNSLLDLFSYNIILYKIVQSTDLLLYCKKECSKSFETEAEFTKIEMNDELNISFL